MRRPAAILIVGLSWAALLQPQTALACGPTAPLSSAELLAFQTDIIDRGLKREILSEAERADIARLRGEVEAAHKADRRADARAAMLKIVAMFRTDGPLKIVEPLVPACAPPMKTPIVIGTLANLTIEPNRPGARCGNHYVLTVKVAGSKAKPSRFVLYDMAKVSSDLSALQGKAIEIETVGGSVVTAIRPAGAKPDTPGQFAALSPVRPC